MRWFASFYLTLVVALVVVALAGISRLGIPWISDVLAWFYPDELVQWWSIPLIVTGCYSLVRLILQRVVAYTESAIDASPRETRNAWSQRRAAIGSAAYRWFGNPTGRWLAPFALVASIVAGVSGLARWPMFFAAGQIGRVEQWQALGLSFLALYALTLDMAMLFPDRPQRLRPEPEPDPDPMLDLPDDPSGPPAPPSKPPKRRGLFGGRSARKAAPATP